MGKTRALFKKIRDTKGTFHTKMGSIKDRNGMDLTGSQECQAATAQEQPRGATPHLRSRAVAGMSYPLPQAKGGSRE